MDNADPSVVVDWLARQQPPADFYELLGTLRFDPDVSVLSARVRQATRELLSFQSHQDPQKAQRAIRLQLELGRAADLLANPRKLAEYHCWILDRLLTDWQADKTVRSRDGAALKTWLRARHGVHPSALEEAVR